MNNKSKFALSFLVASMLGSVANSKEITTNSALMQAMDKITGRVNKINVPVNSKVSFGDFSLVLRACKKTPAEETPENFAFVDVTDKSFGSDEYNIFRGWIISSSPGINTIEHPIYDVWLLECVDTDISGATILSKEELDARNNLPAKKEVKDIYVENTKEKTEQVKSIHIKEFIAKDTDIEKNIVEISIHEENSIQEGINKPKNLLDFTKEEISVDEYDDLSDEIDEEIKNLRQ